ncbi:hypothetical protein QTP70_023922 [Hemibagrus guttatus]|uniref:BZIP domain-containing protein n=1 Tax=Hemibagrus guttatus TaxID=175788 RepID=A0AAE0PRN5_9TELE|nr:hypothetical protein QTP70_023922 [Hemibagrus guttatus]
MTRRGMACTRSLKVCRGIWHQDVSSRSFKSFSAHAQYKSCFDNHFRFFCCFEKLAVKMADADGVPTPTAENHQDVRVNVKSKRIVSYQLAKYKNLLTKLLERQPDMDESDVEKILQEMLLNFELAVQENISVGGLSWDEAAEENSEDYECSTMDDLLDEKIVQTSWKRSIYPKKILPYFVRSLKAERKLMGLLDGAVKAQEVKRDPVQDDIMSSVSAAAPRMFSQASTVMKSLKDLKQVAEGLHQVLNTQPSTESLEVYRDVFSSEGNVQCSRESANRHSIVTALLGGVKRSSCLGDENLAVSPSHVYNSTSCVLYAAQHVPPPAMSLHTAPDCCGSPGLHLYRRSQSEDDSHRRLKRREKNRVAAQRSRKRQTQRADELHEAYECLEQQNSLLKKEVQLLLEEQRCLADALKLHEPLCPVLNSSVLPGSRPSDGLPP